MFTIVMAIGVFIIKKKKITNTCELIQIANEWKNRISACEPSADDVDDAKYTIVNSKMKRNICTV